MRVLYVEDIENTAAREWAERLTKTMEREFDVVPADTFSPEMEADFLFFATGNQSRRVQHWLNLSRELRVPYVFLTPQMHYPLNSSNSPQGVLNTILAPVTMLEEEVHKAELLSHLARYTDASLTLLTAHDYGSRARTNTDKIRTFLETRQKDLGKQFVITEQTAKADSLSLHKEVMSLRTADLIVWTASRDYGLDDLIFGPAERKLILHSAVPVVLLNPRGDLFSLCD